MTTNTENVVCIYDDKGGLVAIAKRDNVSGHKMVYMTKEASVDQIALLIHKDETVA